RRPPSPPASRRAGPRAATRSRRSPRAPWSRPGPGRPRRSSRLQLEAAQVLAEGAAQVRPLQGELHRGLEEAQLVAGVVAGALEAVAVDRALVPQGPQAVGELDLA